MVGQAGERPAVKRDQPDGTHPRRKGGAVREVGLETFQRDQVHVLLRRLRRIDRKPVRDHQRKPARVGHVQHFLVLHVDLACMRQAAQFAGRRRRAVEVRRQRQEGRGGQVDRAHDVAVAFAVIEVDDDGAEHTAGIQVAHCAQGERCRQRHTGGRHAVQRHADVGAVEYQQGQPWHAAGVAFFQHMFPGQGALVEDDVRQEVVVLAGTAIGGKHRLDVGRRQAEPRSLHRKVLGTLQRLSGAVEDELLGQPGAVVARQ